MANELTYTIRARFIKGSVDKTLSVEGAQSDVTGTAFHNSFQSITTAIGGKAVDLGDVPEGGLIAVRNTDSSNYVDLIDNVSSTGLLRVLAGETQFFRLIPTVDLFAQADTADVVIETWAVEA